VQVRCEECECFIFVLFCFCFCFVFVLFCFCFCFVFVFVFWGYFWLGGCKWDVGDVMQMRYRGCTWDAEDVWAKKERGGINNYHNNYLDWTKKKRKKIIIFSIEMIISFQIFFHLEQSKVEWVHIKSYNKQRTTPCRGAFLVLLKNKKSWFWFFFVFSFFAVGKKTKFSQKIFSN